MKVQALIKPLSTCRILIVRSVRAPWTLRGFIVNCIRSLVMARLLKDFEPLDLELCLVWAELESLEELVARPLPEVRTTPS